MSSEPRNSVFPIRSSPLSLFQSTKSLTVMAEDVAIADDIARSSLHQGESPASPESKDEGLDKFGESAVDPEEDELENLPIWNTYNQEAIKADASMVEGSHREIDVLLVFTGLFSAVLTTFIIQTYQMILPDPIDETNQLLGDLKNITLQLAAVQMAPNIQTLTPLRQSSNGDVGLPDSQIEWVNGLWFAALACSLSAALVSMLAKQWLYAYTRGISGSPRDRARKRQNRFIQFRSWHVLTVINCLPLLLHAALFLFFGGIVVLLWQEKLVPISVATIVIVALAYIFYAGSMWISLVSPDCPYQHPISTHLHDWLKPSRDRHASCRTGKRRSRLIRSEPTWNLDENTQEKEQTLLSSLSDQVIVPTREDALDATALIWLLKESTSTEAVRSSALHAIAELPRDFTAYSLLVQANATGMILQRFESCFKLDTSVGIRWEVKDPQAAEKYCRGWMRLAYQTRLKWPTRLLRPLEILRDEVSHPSICATATCVLALCSPERYSAQNDLLSLLSRHVDGQVSLSVMTQQLVLDTLLECIAHWELAAAVIANVVSRAVPILIRLLYSLTHHGPYTLREAASLNLYALTGHFLEEEARRESDRRKDIYWEASLRALSDVVMQRTGYGVEDREMDMVGLELARLTNVLVTNSRGFPESLHKSVKVALTALYVENRITIATVNDSDTMANILHILHPLNLSDAEQQALFTKHLTDILKHNRHSGILYNALRLLESHLASYSTVVMETFLDEGGMDTLLHIANMGNIDGRRAQMDSLRALCTFIEASATLQLEDDDFPPSFFDTIFQSSFLNTLCSVLTKGRWWIPDVAEIWMPALVKLCRVRAHDPSWRKVEKVFWKYAGLHQNEYRQSDLVNGLNRIRDLRRELEGGVGISFFEEDF